jgi:hypothetical protein
MTAAGHVSQDIWRVEADEAPLGGLHGGAVVVYGWKGMRQRNV